MFEKMRAPVALVFVALLFAQVLPALAASPGQQSTAAALGQVNLNTAGAAELELLPRVGPALAKRIVEYREKNGAFKSAEELMLVRGIGEKTFSLMEPYVAIGGKTTLKEKVRSPSSRAGSTR